MIFIRKFPKCNNREPFNSLSKWNPYCFRDYPKDINDDDMDKLLMDIKIRGTFRKCKWLLSRDLCPENKNWVTK